jgi:hypothetical protein
MKDNLFNESMYDVIYGDYKNTDLNVYDDTYEYKKFVVDNFGDNNE